LGRYAPVVLSQACAERFPSLSRMYPTTVARWSHFVVLCGGTPPPTLHASTHADIFVLNDLGEWESSVREDGGIVNFGLTLSKSELVAVSIRRARF
jgi:hypothetical protein